MGNSGLAWGLTFSVILMGVQSSNAERFTVPSAPTSYGQIETEVTSRIPNALSAAQCGGWSDESIAGGDESAASAPNGQMRVTVDPDADEGGEEERWVKQDTGQWHNFEAPLETKSNAQIDAQTIEVVGKIPYVWGVPGHRWKWDANVDSGMAGSPSDLIFPDSTEGLSFANYQSNEWCRTVRSTNPSCLSPGECNNLCAGLNQKTYRVYRVAECYKRGCNSGSSSSSTTIRTATCNPEFYCSNTCPRNTKAFTHPAEPTGRVRICLSNTTNRGTYYMIHELVHAKQRCEGTVPSSPTLAECCAFERPAWEKQCEAMENNGVFFKPDGTRGSSNGVPFDARSCADALTNTSCEDLGICNTPPFPAIAITNFVNASTQGIRDTCAQAQTKVDPRVQAGIDEAKRTPVVISAATPRPTSEFAIASPATSPLTAQTMTSVSPEELAYLNESQGYVGQLVTTVQGSMYSQVSELIAMLVYANTLGNYMGALISSYPQCLSWASGDVAYMRGAVNLLTTNPDPLLLDPSPLLNVLQYLDALLSTFPSALNNCSSYTPPSSQYYCVQGSSSADCVPSSTPIPGAKAYGDGATCSANCKYVKKEKCEYRTDDKAYYEKRAKELPSSNAMTFFDCNTCIGNDIKIRLEFAGDKYYCTGNEAERTGNANLSGISGPLLKEKYGWVWGDTYMSKILPQVNPSARDLCLAKWVEEPTEYPNCIACGREDSIVVPGVTTKEGKTPGLECRCPAESSGVSGCRSTERTSPKNNATYESFMRTYRAQSVRQPTGPSSSELTSGSARAACFGYLSLRDPKVTTMVAADLQCVIDMNDSAFYENRKTTQMGKGEYGERSNLPDLAEEPRDSDFDQLKDPWYENIGGAFSFLNPDVLKHPFSSLIPPPDKAAVLTTVQIDSEHPLAESALKRDTEDTVTDEAGDKRVLSMWWKEMETQMNRILTPPVVRLFLPAPWFMSLDPLRPIATDDVELDNFQALSVDMTIHAGESIPDMLARYMRGIAVNFQEEDVNVLTPAVTDAKLTSLSQSWCAWWERRWGLQIKQMRVTNGTPEEDAHQGISCDMSAGSGPFPAGANEELVAVQELMATFQGYMAQKEGVRLLRAEHARVQADLLKKGQEYTQEVDLWIAEWLGAWMEDSQEAYVSYINGLEERYALGEKWREVQQAFVDLHDDLNFPWCYNAEFTPPVYHLQNNLPGRPSLSGGSRSCTTSSSSSASSSSSSSEDGLPIICLPDDLDEKNLVFDFSNVPLLRRLVLERIIPVPVLKVTEVEINLPAPPPIDDPLDPRVADLMDFPPIPSIHDYVATASPEFGPTESDEEPPTITFPPPLDLAQPAEALDEALTVLEDMQRPYQEFFDAAKRPNQTLICPDWGVFPCIFPEANLIESFMRFWARRAIMVTENREFQGEPRPAGYVKGPEQCPPEDHACQILLPEELFHREYEQQPPQIDMPAEWRGFLETIRSAVRSASITSAGEVLNAFPYIVPTEKLYEIFRVPGVVDLFGRPRLPLPIDEMPAPSSTTLRTIVPINPVLTTPPFPLQPTMRTFPFPSSTPSSASMHTVPTIP